MRTIFLDTSALVRDYTILYGVAKERVVIPLRVVDELGRRRQNGKGDEAWNAQCALDFINREGITIDRTDALPYEDRNLTIIRAILSWKQRREDEGEEALCVLIAEDTGLRVRAAARGLEVGSTSSLPSPLKKGLSPVELSDSSTLSDTLRATGVLDEQDLKNHASELEDLPLWSCVVFNSTKPHQLGVWDGSHIRKIEISRSSVDPKGLEQTYTLWALQEASVPLVTITGAAGTGKSFLALGEALDSLKRGSYKRLVIVKNFQEVGKSLGFLPGDIGEKMAPWMDSIKDTLKAVVGPGGVGYFEMMEKKGDVEIIPLSYVRGRTFENCYVIMDEAQNTSPHEIKTVVTRMGRGSKVVLLGDTEQIDGHGYGEQSCGLAHVIRSFQNSRYSVHAHLTTSRRSDLAGEAARLL